MRHSPLRWILLPALMTFAGGFLAGISVNAQVSSRESLEELAPDLRAYAESLGQILELEPEQAEDLKILLFHYERERAKLLQHRLAELDTSWVALDQRFENLLANRILTPDQRGRAERLRAPLVVVAEGATR